jgi:superfamily II DNA or RNA helicase
MTPSSLPLRQYQKEDLENLNEALAGREHWAWAGGHRFRSVAAVNRVAMVWATGLGKTVAFSHQILFFAASLGGGRVLVLVHRDELAQQAKAKIHGVAPHLRVGIVMAGRNEVEADVIIASVQTIGPALAREQDGKPGIRPARAHDIRGIGMIIVDEAHHAAAPSWRAVLKHFGSFHGVPTIGFTATMSREDSRGLGEIWQEVVAKRDTLWGIRHGYLADVRGIRVQVPRLDLDGVHVRAGDLQQEEVATAMLDANTGEAIAKSLIELAPDRRPVVFAPNVATATDFADSINDVGIKTETILGSTKPAERAGIFDRFRSGVTQCLTNAMVLTEGWDAPWADCAVIARPTKSPALYQQMVGRVLRPWKAGGKKDALILDVVGAASKHQLSSLIDLSMDRPPKQGQSVLEAWDEFEEDELMAAEYLAGNLTDDDLYRPARVHKVIGTEIDLFADSDSVWLQTYKGTWFIPAGDLLFFIWPEPVEGMVTVGVTSATVAALATPLLQGVTMEMGMSWAEQYAAEHDKSRPALADLTSRSASWRHARPSAAMRSRAFRADVWIDKDWNQGQVIDAINVDQASRRLDR